MQRLFQVGFATPVLALRCAFFPDYIQAIRRRLVAPPLAPPSTCVLWVCQLIKLDLFCVRVCIDATLAFFGQQIIVARTIHQYFQGFFP